MKIEKPILFSTDMVRGILDGRKTQTRRPIGIDLPHKLRQVCPPSRYRAHILWVRETWRPKVGYEGVSPSKIPHDEEITYLEDCISHPHNHSVFGMPYQRNYDCSKWRPSIHMPRHFSRINLLVESVEIERLQDISEADAKADGGQPHEQSNSDLPSFLCQELGVRYKPAFSFLWDSIYEEQGFGWDNNPWVWVIKFKKI